MALLVHLHLFLYCSQTKCLKSCKYRAQIDAETLTCFASGSPLSSPRSADRALVSSRYVRYCIGACCLASTLSGAKICSASALSCSAFALSTLGGIVAILQMARGSRVHSRICTFCWYVKTVEPDLKPDVPGGTVISNGFDLFCALLDLVIPTS